MDKLSYWVCTGCKVLAQPCYASFEGDYVPTVCLFNASEYSGVNWHRKPLESAEGANLHPPTTQGQNAQSSTSPVA